MDNNTNNNFPICSICKKRKATVFLASGDGQKAICMHCLSEMGIKPVGDMMKQLGISPEEAEKMSNELSLMIGDVSSISKEMLNKLSEQDTDALNNLVEQLSGGMPIENLQELTENLVNQDENSEDSDESDDSTTNFFGKIFNTIKDTASNIGSGSGDKSEGDLPGENKPKNSTKPNSKSSKNKNKKEKRKFLTTYCDDLTAKAKSGKLDEIVGREKEIYRVMQILNRRSKNNPCLIGEPGVGKTAIAEGIALKIASGNVPLRLKNKEIYQLDLTALVAGTQFRGQFESRVKGLLDEVTKSGDIILFVDEVHNLVGAGESEGGAMSAANIFKPALSRGEVQIIGATTFKEYRKHIEKDTALERRFQPITVEEPSIEDSIEVLKGIKNYYESHHRVIISDEIIKEAVVLSERYITDRFLPDKAIDLIDEASSSRALESAELDKYDLLIQEKEELIEFQEEIELDTEIDYEKLYEVRAELITVDEKIAEIEPKIKNIRVTEDDLAKIIELWTGIPSAKIKANSIEKVANLNENLKKKIVGQDEACELVSAAVRRSRVQISARRKPASFIFVGPTAVGKTELVKVLSKELFDTPDPLIRVDMSEYMEEYSVSKIIGSAPGYVGYDDAGQLTEQVRRKPYSVILFDEIEKAHPNVLNILLQILDEGKVTDSQGRKVNFQNTVIIMTSNAGSQFKDASMGFNKTEKDISREKVMKSLNEFLRPEFLSRIDEVVVFNPLTKENFAGIAKILLDEIIEPLKEKSIDFSYNKTVCAYIAEKSYGKKTGAREIRRIIRKEIEDEIALMIVNDPSGYPRVMRVVIEDNKLKLLTQNQ